MNHREPPLLPVDSRRALLFVALLLLPGFAATHTRAVSRSGNADSTPYLLAAGAPPLRFREPTPRPKVSPRPLAGAPPIPQGEALTPAAVTNRPDVIPAPPATSAPTDAAGKSATPANETAPAAIIPDDTRPNVRPEDFLPFFQIPGTAGAPVGVDVIAPVPKAAPTPASIPASSATYTQTPR